MEVNDFVDKDEHLIKVEEHLIRPSDGWNHATLVFILRLKLVFLLLKFLLDWVLNQSIVLRVQIANAEGGDVNDQALVAWRLEGGYHYAYNLIDKNNNKLHKADKARHNEIVKFVRVILYEFHHGDGALHLTLQSEMDHDTAHEFNEKEQIRILIRPIDFRENCFLLRFN